MAESRKIKVQHKGGFHPLTSLRDEGEHMLERMVQGYRNLRGMVHFPRTDASESGERYEISVELPGMDETDIELSVSDDMLVLTGEKRQENEDEGAYYYLMERSYGAFQRVYQIPVDAKADKIDARFSKGVLTISIPRKAGKKSGRRAIPVKSG
jgi:HSP20 family protein